MKKAILAAIICVLAIDLMMAAMPRYFLAALSIWLIGPVECSFAEFVKENESVFAIFTTTPKFTLIKSESGLDLWNTPQGLVWTVRGDRKLSFLMSEQLRDIYEPQGHEVRKGDIVLDCGANVGMFTRKALWRGASLVVAIEPAPRTLDALRRNFETEIREGRVIVYAKGVWDHDAEMELSLDEVNPAANSVVKSRDPAIPKVRVPLTTIDKIVAELKLPRVDFIKMDIEGAEKPALKGGENTIRRFRPTMSISTEHLEDDFTAIPALVHAIEPNYTNKACDCFVEKKGPIRALVMAFDPVP